MSFLAAGNPIGGNMGNANITISKSDVSQAQSLALIQEIRNRLQNLNVTVRGQFNEAI